VIGVHLNLLPGGRQATEPTALALFPARPQLPPRHEAERTENLVRWTEFDRDGTSRGWRSPTPLVGDVRAFLRELREKGVRPAVRGALCRERICRGQRIRLRASSEVKSGVDSTSAVRPRPICHDEENR
jgi:hypothetical protein